MKLYFRCQKALLPKSSDASGIYIWIVSYKSTVAHIFKIKKEENYLISIYSLSQQKTIK